MREQVEKRLSELGAELRAGQQMLAELDAKRADVQQTLLRISGAIQVLTELLDAETDRVDAPTDPTRPAASSPAPQAATSPAPRAATSPAPQAAMSPVPRAATSPTPQAAMSPAPRAATSPTPQAAMSPASS